MKSFLKMGCGCGLLLTVGVGALGYWWYRTGLEAPANVEVEVELPDGARVGEEVELALTVRNLRQDKPFRIGDVAIDNSFHDRFSLVGVTPSPELQHDMQMALVVLYRFGLDVQAGAEERIVFRLRAEKPGTARGEVMVGEGRRSVIRQVALEIGP